MKKKTIVSLLFAGLLVFVGCNLDLDYIEYYPEGSRPTKPAPNDNRIERYTFVKLATGKHVEIWCEENYSIQEKRNTRESFIKKNVYEWDKDFEDITSFLGLYPRGDSPNTKVQVYHYPGNGGSQVHTATEAAILMNGFDGPFSHEFGHLISYRETTPYSGFPGEKWFSEFVAIMTAEYVKDDSHYRGKIVGLFDGWREQNNDYYYTYTKLSKFLFKTYGNSFFYDLMHAAVDDGLVNQAALEFCLNNRGVTLNGMVNAFKASKWYS